MLQATVIVAPLSWLYPLTNPSIVILTHDFCEEKKARLHFIHNHYIIFLWCRNCFLPFFLSAVARPATYNVAGEDGLQQKYLYISGYSYEPRQLSRRDNQWYLARQPPVPKIPKPHPPFFSNRNNFHSLWRETQLQVGENSTYISWWLRG